MKKELDDILKQYPYIGEDIQKAQAELNRYITLQEKARDPMKAQNMDGMPRGSDISDPTYQRVEKIIDRYQTEIDESIKKINNLLDTKKWLDKAFSQLSREEYELIRQYYWEHMSIRYMAKQRKCGREQIKNMISFICERIKKVVL